MSNRSAERHGLARTFAIPAVLAAASIIGLGGGLLGSGWWDVVAWCGVGAAVAVPVIYFGRSMSSR